MSHGTLMLISITAIEENPVALRTVARDSEKYKNLVSSVRDRGILNPISVRETGDGYTVVDGLHRFSAALDAGLEKIPVQVLDIAEADILEVQIEANLQKVETKPGEYTKQLLRIMADHPDRTIEEQAARLHKSPAWLKERLNFRSLTDEAMRRIDLPETDDEHISISNAYSLAKLPPEVQDEWLDRACSLPPTEFIPAALAEIKRLRTQARTGVTVEATGPAPILRKRGLLTSELDRARNLPANVEPEKKDYAEGYRDAFLWIFKQDPASIEAWKKEQEALAAEKKEKAEKRKAEKEAKEAKEAEDAGKAPSMADLLGVNKKPAAAKKPD